MFLTMISCICLDLKLYTNIMRVILKYVPYTYNIVMHKPFLIFRKNQIKLLC